VGVAHPPAQLPSDHLLKPEGVVHALLKRSLQGSDEKWAHVVEHRVVFHEAASVDVRTADDLGGVGVDHRDDRNEAFLTEDAPVAQ